MVPEDRDPIFEKALARHLRAKLSSPRAPREGGETMGAPNASASSGVAPEFSAPEFSADAACPNPEVLAAYHERLLVPEEMARLKGHIATCDRCQEILATLEATDDLLLPSDRTAGEHHNVVTMPAPPVEIPAEIVAAAAPGPLPRPSRSARRAQSSWRSKTLRGANWKWLAPAGAIAAILLLWVGFHESHPSTFELAKNTQPAAAPPAASSATRAVTAAPPSNELADRAKSELSTAPRSQADALPREEARKREQVMLDEKKSVDAVAAKPAAPHATTAAPKVVGSAPAPPPLDRDSRDVGLTAQTRVDSPSVSQKSDPAPADSAAQPARAYAQDQNKDDSAESQAEGVAQSKAESAAKAKLANGRQAPEQDKQRAVGNVVNLQEAENLASRQISPMLRVAKMSGSNVISAPNTVALWRLSQAGIIEHSTDAGATWNVQASGVVNELLGGSAPSASVCWVVGREGTVLRTTDGGAHWQKLNAPTAEDLTAVFAVNAQQATVTIKTPPKFYRTTDAGQTWTQLPNP